MLLRVARAAKVIGMPVSQDECETAMRRQRARAEEAAEERILEIIVPGVRAEFGLAANYGKLLRNALRVAIASASDSRVTARQAPRVRDGETWF